LVVFYHLQLHGGTLSFIKYKSVMFDSFKRRLSSLFEFSGTPKSKFKVGEMVVHEEAVHPMVIKQVVKSLKRSDPLLYCQWFDKTNRETRMTLLHESKLRPFDWDKR
jgi:hypothetical protein